MPKKRQDSPVFEIVVVLAIVAIVAVTGQVLMRYEMRGGITGLAVADYEEEAAKKEFLDVGVDEIKVNTPSPLIGEPFEIRVIIANKGFKEINTPFYVEVKLVHQGEKVKPTLINSAIIQILEPGEESTAIFRIATITKEGPVRIIATADPTNKLDDDNPSNNQRSKTIIITSE